MKYLQPYINTSILYFSINIFHYILYNFLIFSNPVFKTTPEVCRKSFFKQIRKLRPTGAPTNTESGNSSAALLLLGPGQDQDPLYLILSEIFKVTTVCFRVSLHRKFLRKFHALMFIKFNWFLYCLEEIQRRITKVILLYVLY